MRRKLRFFRQHTCETCGISCILMLLDHYRKVHYPTKKMEQKLYGIYRSRAFGGLPGSFAADCLARNGLQVELLHSSEAFLENRDGYFEEELFEKILAEYRRRAEACAGQVEIRTGMELDCQVLKALLAEEKLVMVQCIVPGDADGIHTEVLHWVLVYGWQEGSFRLFDPNFGKAAIPEADMARYLDTPVGKIFLTVRERSR